MYNFFACFFYRFTLFSIFDWSICTLFSELHVANVSIRCITNIIMVFELMNSLFQAPFDKINIFFFPMFKRCRVFYLFFWFDVDDDDDGRWCEKPVRRFMFAPSNHNFKQQQKHMQSKRKYLKYVCTVQPNHTYIFARNHPPYSTPRLLKCTFYSKHALYDINWR